MDNDSPFLFGADVDSTRLKCFLVGQEKTKSLLSWLKRPQPKAEGNRWLRWGADTPPYCPPWQRAAEEVPCWLLP